MFIERGQAAKTIMTLQLKLPWNLNDKVKHGNVYTHIAVHVLACLYIL
jgi:hypothetical protein